MNKDNSIENEERPRNQAAANGIIAFKEKVSFFKQYLLFGIAFMIACFIYAVPALICLYALLWLLEGNLKEKFSKALKSKIVWLFWIFYLLHLTGMLYTPYVKAGWFDLQVKLSLFLFPLFLVSEQKMDFKKQRIFMWVFIIGLITNGLICLAHAIWLLVFQNIFQFQYAQFSLFLHPSYYTMYIDLAVVFIFYLLAENRKSGNKKGNVWLFVSFFFLEFLIVLLQSKMGMIVSASVIVIVIVKYMAKENPWPTAIVLIAGVIGLYFAAYHYIITANRSRMVYAIQVLETEHLTSKSPESTQVRLYVWRAGLKIVKDHLLLGFGTGAEHEVLVDEYVKESMAGALEKRLNAHNQYLETLLELGIPGLLSLLATLLIPLVIAIKQKRFIYTMFLYIFITNILVESVLQVQSGTIFYGFFNSFFMFNFVI